MGNLRAVLLSMKKKTVIQVIPILYSHSTKNVLISLTGWKKETKVAGLKLD